MFFNILFVVGGCYALVSVGVVPVKAVLSEVGSRWSPWTAVRHWPCAECERGSSKSMHLPTPHLSRPTIKSFNSSKFIFCVCMMEIRILHIFF